MSETAPLRWEERDRLNVTVEWDGEQFCARCREYNLMATGKTLNEAREALWSMIQQYLALTNPQTWHDYFTTVQQIDEENDTAWASGEHTIN